MKYYKTAGCFALLYLFVYIFLSFTVGIIVPSGNTSTIIIYLAMLLFAIGFLLLCHDDVKKILRLRMPRISVLLLTILLVIASHPLISFVNSVSLLFAHDITSSAVSRNVAENAFLSFVSIAIMPAIVEEVIFRGVLFSKLRAARPIKGILLSSLFFGLSHLNFNQMSYAILMGIIFALVVEITDSILPSMLMHFLFNGNSVLLDFLSKRISLPSTVATTQVSVHTCLILLPFAVVSLVASIALLYVIAKFSNRLGYVKTWFKKDIRRSLPKDCVTNVSFYIAIFILFLLTIMMELFLSL